MGFRLLVCGGRDYTDTSCLEEVLTWHARPDLILIEGGAKGADRIARNWAKDKGYEVLTFEANWNKYGNRAGPIRNQQMLDEGRPDKVLAFPTKKSAGTWDMVERARKAMDRQDVYVDGKYADERKMQRIA